MFTPFADSIRFYMNNWMRLWLCGWDPEDYKTADDKFLDLKQKKISPYTNHSLNVPQGSETVWPSDSSSWKDKKVDMADELMKYADDYFTEAFRGSENVSDRETRCP